MTGGYASEPLDASLSASGGSPPYSWVISDGALPTGVALSPEGALTGSPTQSGEFAATAQVTDARGDTASAPIALTLLAQPSLSSAPPPRAVVGEGFWMPLEPAGGKAPLRLAHSTGVLPPGLALSQTGLGGTPTTAGSHTFTVEVTDANGRRASRSIVLAIHSPPAVATSILITATVGLRYSATLQATGGKDPVTFSAASPPPGLTLSPSGVLSGTPTTAGSYAFAVTVTDADGRTGQRSLTLLVNSTARAIFKAAAWNIEWFGSTSNGPTNETLQRSNAAKVISRAGFQVWGLQELVEASAFRGLLTDLGANFDGILANDPSVSLGSTHYTATQQKLGLIWDKRIIRSVTDRKLILTDATCTNAFAGRPPLEATVSGAIEGTAFSGRIIVLHAKAHTDPFDTSYERRKQGAVCLKTYLDTLPNEPVLVLGDWNDDMDRSITTREDHPSCVSNDGTFCVTPYANFVGDTVNYKATTLALSLIGTSSTRYPDLIDHHVATNELGDLFIPGSAVVVRPDLWATDPVLNFMTTTSDHYPVGTSYQLAAPRVFINEIRYTEVTANEFGSEFVEIVNVGDGVADLSGWTLQDHKNADGSASTVVRHIFPAGTQVGRGKAIVIFSSATYATVPNSYGASSGGLSLHPNDGLSLRDPNANTIDSHSWTSDFSIRGLSANRATDLDPTTGFAPHNAVTTAEASPGTRADGRAF